jgi:hypothetical protein
LGTNHLRDVLDYEHGGGRALDQAAAAVDFDDGAAFTDPGLVRLDELLGLREDAARGVSVADNRPASYSSRK